MTKHLKIYIFVLFIILLFIFILGIIINYFTKKNKKNKKNEIYYIENFFSKNEFKTILNTINSHTNKEKPINESFRLTYPISSKIIENIFYSDKTLNKIKNITNNNQIYKSIFPIECRIYPLNSKGMKCHKDLLLYQLPQYEAVFTIKNTSDSYTTWYDINNNRQHKIYTKPNSLLLVKANSNIHCVSPITKGSRSIIKLIYTQTKNIHKNYKKEINRFNKT